MGNSSRPAAACAPPQARHTTMGHAADGTAPRISILIPSFNSGPYLPLALRSVLDQEPPPYEILVQDGGSSDETIDFLRSIGDRVSWNSTPDDGQSDALNRALARATGDVVLWLNADDLLLPGAIDAATRAFAGDPDLAFVYGDFDIVDAEGNVMRRYRSSPYSWERIYARGCYIFSGSMFIRRESLEGIGGFDASLRACMDLDLMLRLDSAGRSAHLERTIAQLRMHATNKSSSLMSAFLFEGLRVRLRHSKRSPRRILIALRAAAAAAITLAATRIRFSSRWPRHGRTKVL